MMAQYSSDTGPSPKTYYSSGQQLVLQSVNVIILGKDE